jgi:hypothetical protein
VHAVDLGMIGFVAIVLAEQLLFWVVPSWFAPLALVPMPWLRRRLPVPERSWMPAAGGGASSYREAPPRDIDWTTLPVLDVVSEDELVGAFVASKRALVVRLRTRGKRAVGSAVVRLRREGDMLVVDPRMVPVPGLSLVIGACVCIPLAASSVGFYLAFATAMLVFGVGGALWRMTNALRPSVDLFEAQMSAFGP